MMEKNASLANCTALLVGMLYRAQPTGEWAFEIIAEGAQGLFADLVAADDVVGGRRLLAVIVLR